MIPNLQLSFTKFKDKINPQIMPHPISDLHLHCSLKGYAADGHPDFTGQTIWDFFEERKPELQKLNGPLRKAIENTAKSSQANLDACVEAGLRAPFLAVYPVERQLFDCDPQKPFKALFSLLLAGKQPAYLGSAVSGFPLDRVERIIASFDDGCNVGVNYYEEFLKERSWVLRQRDTRSKKYRQHRFEIASDHGEFQDMLADDKTVCGILTVEGAHSFGHYLRNTTFKKEFEALEDDERKILESSMLRNIAEVKTEEFTPFFVTFCHHFNNHLAGHARSFSDKAPLFLGFNKPGMRHLFNQTVGMNRGFTSLGRQALDLMFDRSKGRRILVDCKHMSLQSRREFYAVIREKREKGDPIPIIHSHTAINGWWTLDMAEKAVETADLDRDQYFSRWPINLTNEDILETYDSDGLIGVILHESRMPGEAFKEKARQLKKKADNARPGSDREIRFRLELMDLYLQLLWSNIFHIVKVVKEGRPGSKPADAWGMIALGSDYDGLVDPFDTFPEVAGFQDLKRAMAAYLDSGQPLFFSQNGEAVELPEAEIQELLSGQTPTEVLDRILFGNTERFLGRYFTEGYLGPRSQ